MATQTKTFLIDDIDASEAAERINFSYKGVDYRIDLSEEHAKQFHDQMHYWASHAQRYTIRSRRANGRVRRHIAASSDYDIQEVRKWAQENGYKVSSRGRVAASIVDAYREAKHSTSDSE